MKNKDKPLTSKKSRNADDFSKRVSPANVGPNGGTFLDRETAMLKHRKWFIFEIPQNPINSQKFLQPQFSKNFLQRLM